ncbi:AfsR/SARP family transcriptional regulator [Amycolatopsis sp. lyj-23]|uniref:AfsR/SARP family transcriptional regulator n=1 Tax=Amycolatopsis sp. lyj-23 TaxID=2789283 RepID=UPI003977FA29
MAVVEFRLLGPFEVVVDGVAVPVRSGKLRVLLASLLLRADDVVPTGTLIERMWDGAPVSDSRATLHVHMTRLRQFLARTGSGATVRTVPGGYVLDVPPGSVDLARFAEAAKAAAAAHDEGDVGTEAALLAGALALWRGPALADVPSDALHRDEVPPLDEQHLRLAERWFDIELQRGRHAEVVTDLQAFTARYPLRERLWGQLMLALHRGRRHAEALAVYRSLRQVLAEQLGISPGPQVSRLYQEILEGSPGAGGEGARDANAGWRFLCQLPADSATFVGRADVIDEVSELLAPEGPVSGVPVVRLSGSPGVGKTALAVRIAHRLRSAFPDGQWYVRLNGAQKNRRRPGDVLSELLRASGLDASAIPDDVDDRSAVYRARLADRRVLIVLDDAGDFEQVAALLPGTPGCAVLVTARTQLSDLVALSGARPVTLGVLSESEAVTVIGRLVGPDRVAVDPGAVAELAKLCAYLPLALRIAAANLAGRPHTTVAAYVAELRHGDLLAELAAGGGSRTAVRAAFELSYRALSPAARRLFRLLGLAPGPDLTAPVAARLAGIPVEQAYPMLHQLAEAQLVEPSTAGRFRFHDLLRLYAAERAHDEDTGEARAEALDRLYNWYLHSADAAIGRCYENLVHIGLPTVRPDTCVPSFADSGEALAWLDEERANLLAIAGQAATNGLAPYSWALADTLRGYLWLERHHEEWLTAVLAGLGAARKEGDADAANVMRFGLGLVQRCLGDPVESNAQLSLALAHFRRQGMEAFEAATLNAIGILHLHKDLGSLDDAITVLDRALEISRRLRIPHVEARTLRNLGAVRHARGDLVPAAEHFAESLEVYRRVGAGHSEPDILSRLGLVFADRGRFPEAAGYLERALELGIRVRAVNHQAIAHYGLAVVLAHTCRVQEAAEHARQGLRLAGEASYRAVEANCLNAMASTARCEDRPERARAYHLRALALAREIGQEQAEIEALVGLAADAGYEFDTAAGFGRQAWEIARRGGFLLHEGRALTTLAATHLAVGRIDEAAEFAARARQRYERTGYGLGKATLDELVTRIGAARLGATRPR